MSTISLVVIFNHKYDKNIPLIKKIYEKRFHSIHFLVPFYTGDDQSVIPVFESSYQFQGYITQAYEKLREEDCSHYIFIGDDLILNPALNEDNILSFLGVGTEDAYIESLTTLKETQYWQYYRFSDAHKAFHSKSVNFVGEIPTIKDARNKAHHFEFDNCTIKGNVKCKSYPWKNLRSNANDLFNRIFNPVDIEYPLVTGYSDFFVLPSTKLEEFSRLSGVFAAMRLFVEISIPTTLMLLMDKERLKMQEDATISTPKLWWITDTATDFEKKCNFSIDNMVEHWPDNYAYLHPIKLSKWK